MHTHTHTHTPHTHTHTTHTPHTHTPHTPHTHTHTHTPHTHTHTHTPHTPHTHTPHTHTHKTCCSHWPTYFPKLLKKCNMFLATFLSRVCKKLKTIELSIFGHIPYIYKNFRFVSPKHGSVATEWFQTAMEIIQIAHQCFYYYTSSLRIQNT
jgi:hypothetical protein